MDRALIVSAGANSNEYLARHISAMGYPRPVIAASGNEARRLLGASEYDLVVVNTPLPDEFGHEVGVFATEHSLAGVIVLVKAEAAETAAHQVEDYGVLVLPKPFGAPQLQQAIRLARACNRRLRMLEEKNDKLQEKLAQVRLVDRAKCALIEKHGLTEADAHRFIEKQAMDSRQTRGQVAQMILEGSLVP